MTYKISYKPTSPTTQKNNQTFTLSVMVEWDASDAPITPADTFTLTLGTAQPPTGAIKSTTGTFPLALNFNSKNIDTINRQALITAKLSGTQSGNVSITGYLTSQPAVKATYDIKVIPANITLSTDGFDKRILPVADSDTLDTSAPDEYQTKLIVKAMSQDTTPAPIADVPITLSISNPASFSVNQSGNFFDLSSGTAQPINADTSHQSPTLDIKLVTNADGEAILGVVSNKHSGFIYCRINGGTNSVTPARLYIYEEPIKNSTYEGPMVSLPFGKDVEFNTTKYSKPDFPITITANVSPNEFCTVILNDKYQIDQPGSAFDDNTLVVDGITADLNTSAEGEDNTLFYAVSNLGLLTDSQRYTFKVQNTNTDPATGVYIVGPFTSPRIGTMSSTMIFNGMPTTVPLAADQQALAKAGKAPLASPNSYVIYAHVSGWDSNDNFVDKTNLSYPQTITDYTAEVDEKSTDVFDDFADLGRSPDSSKNATWELWYVYYDGPNGTGNKIAESVHTKGILETRNF
ncbi:hypothetical protein ACLBWZ_10470 [Brucellaceae bacterium C25G]